jgi:spermidine/putrescine-binding protein
MKFLMKNISTITVIFLIPLVIFSFSGCELGKDDDTLVITIHEDSDKKGDEEEDDTEPGKSLRILTWDGFVPDEMLEEFQKEFGIKPKMKVLGDDDNLTQLLEKKSSKYDLVIISESDIEGLIEDGLLAELDRENIPNMSDIAPKFSEAPRDIGMEYSVPFIWGTIAIVYNKNEVPEESINWETLQDPAYEGKIDLPNEPDFVFGQGKKILGLSVNANSPEELEEVKELLIEQKKIIRGYFDFEEIANHIRDGSSVIALLPSFFALSIMEENENIGYKVPDNGAPLWIDSWIIPKSAKNKENAEIFINFMLERENAINFSNYVSDPVTILGIRDQINDENLKLGDIFPTDDLLEKCEHYQFPDEKSGDFMYNVWVELGGEDELEDEDLLEDED